MIFSSNNFSFYPECCSKFLLLIGIIFLFSSIHLFADGENEFNNSKNISAAAITTSNVNLRSGPGTKFSSLTIISKGTKLKVISANNNWCKVSFDNKIGYVFKKYLFFEEINEEQSLKNIVNNFFSIWIIFSFPFLWAFFMFNTWRPGYKILTMRGHLLLASILVIVPSIKFTSWLFGESVFLSWQFVQIIKSIFSITDLILIGALFVKSFKTMKPQVVITLILVLSLIVYGDRIGGVGEICLSIISTAMTFDQILLEIMETQSIDKPMEKYFTGFRYK